MRLFSILTLSVSPSAPKDTFNLKLANVQNDKNRRMRRTVTSSLEKSLLGSSRSFGLLGGVAVFDLFRFPLAVGRVRCSRHHLEEGVQPTLGRSLTSLQQLFGAVSDTVFGEALLAAHELDLLTNQN